MPQIKPLHAICYASQPGGDISSFIAPPYDVLDESAKAQLLNTQPHNIVGIDLPHLPAKSAGPDAVYEQAGNTYRQWLDQGVLVRRDRPAVFVYQQTYTVSESLAGIGGRTFQRRGLVANVAVQPFGRSPDGPGAIYPHEQTFSGPKEDRMKLMCATKAQLSPIFGLYSNPAGQMQPVLGEVVDSGSPTFHGTTTNDSVHHEVWAVDDPDQIAQLTQSLGDSDIFIADGHHRYNTALNYRQRLIDEGHFPENGGDHRAGYCMFVLVAMQDPGMIVLPTHRVLGGMPGFTLEKFEQAATGKLKVTPFAGNDLAALEAALPQAGPHAMGLYDPANPQKPLAIATPVSDDPLAQTHSGQSDAWRQLDVAILQHLIVEGICQPHLGSQGQSVAWKFPHSLDELKDQAHEDGYQLGVLMQATPLESVRLVSEAGELMPQKSTFFYPKLATGLAINGLE